MSCCPKNACRAGSIGVLGFKTNRMMPRNPTNPIPAPHCKLVVLLSSNLVNNMHILINKKISNFVLERVVTKMTSYSFLKLFTQKVGLKTLSWKIVSNSFNPAGFTINTCHRIVAICCT